MITNFILTCFITFGKAFLGGCMIFIFAMTSAWIINKIEDAMHEYNAKKAQLNE